MKQDNKISIGYYKKEQWKTLKSLAVDKKDIEDSFEEYESSMNDSIKEMKEIGLEPIIIPIDVLEAYKWCVEKKYPFDGDSRATYISLKTIKFFEEKN